MSLDALEPAPAGLCGTASEAEVVRWVARNIDAREPDAGECPDPFAWTLLRQCRENAAFTQFFIEKLWSKLIPSRSQLEQGGPEELDGQPQLDLIGRIERLRAEAEDPEAISVERIVGDLEGD